MTDKFNDIIAAITKWAKPAPEINCEDKIEDLKSALLSLYSYCISINPYFDDQDYPEYERKDYDEIYKLISKNQPQLGLYQIVSATNVSKKNEIFTEDAVDDLADIVLMLYEFEWRFYNNSPDDALWTLNLDFNTHTENHIAGLIYYLSQL